MRLAIRHLALSVRRSSHLTPTATAAAAPAVGLANGALRGGSRSRRRRAVAVLCRRAGNRIDLVRHDRGAKAEIVVVAAGVVETQDRAGILGHPEGYAPPWIFERETALTKAGDTVRALAQALPIAPQPRRAALADDGSARPYRVCAEPCRRRPVDAETALQSGEGTSRDHAHAFIAAARVLKDSRALHLGLRAGGQRDAAHRRREAERGRRRGGKRSRCRAARACSRCSVHRMPRSRSRSRRDAAAGARRAVAGGGADAAAGRPCVGRGVCGRPAGSGSIRS